MNEKNDKKQYKKIIDREMLMTLNSGCPVCGRSFTLGDPVVYACGSWEGPMKLIHESEAVFDKRKSLYIERECYNASR
ncbi:MAG: hypothetical protein R6V41_02790 [Desulfobacteraceae bacterium]